MVVESADYCIDSYPTGTSQSAITMADLPKGESARYNSL